MHCNQKICFCFAKILFFQCIADILTGKYMAERRRRKPSSIFKKSRKENRNKEIAEVIGIVQMMRDKNIFV